jgi:hypothetical protein
MQAAWLAMGLCAITYVTIGVAGVLTFGEDIKSDLLLNISTIPGRISMVVRTLYCLMLIIHVPYVFLPAKECALVIHDEITRSSISEQIERRINQEASTVRAKKADPENDNLIER